MSYPDDEAQPATVRAAGRTGARGGVQIDQQVILRSAQAHEAGELTRLVLDSKAHWGYAEAFMTACVDELTVTAEQCAAGLVRVADDGVVVGLSMVRGHPPQGELALLYVRPEQLGRGVGRLLLEDALRRARAAGLDTLSIDADPHAEAFYLRMGAVRVGSVPSGSIPGRELPLLSLAVP